MIHLDVIKDELVADALDTCLQDSGYLSSLLGNYFGRFKEEDLRRMHADAFDRPEDYEEDE